MVTMLPQAGKVREPYETALTAAALFGRSVVAITKTTVRY